MLSIPKADRMQLFADVFTACTPLINSTEAVGAHSMRIQCLWQLWSMRPNLPPHLLNKMRSFLRLGANDILWSMVGFLVKIMLRSKTFGRSSESDDSQVKKA